MLRDLQEISDGKIYGCNDMVRAACGDCAGCHACCEKMGTSIVLDPCDIWRLTTVTGKNFEQLTCRYDRAAGSGRRDSSEPEDGRRKRAVCVLE